MFSESAHIEETIAAFALHLAWLGYSESSQRMLPGCLREFLTVMALNPEEIREADILTYRAYLQARPNRRRGGGLSEQMIHHHLYALRLWLSWQLEQGIIDQHPMSGLRFPSPRSQAPQILSLEEIQALYGVCYQPKERVVLSLCYGCGLRRSEAEALDLVDVQLSSGLLYVRSGKGGKRRVVPMSEGVMRDITAWLPARRTSAEPALLLNKQGRRMQGASMYRILKNLLHRSGITKAVGLHSLRHSIATHLLERGMAIETLRDFLGHAHLESTQIYARIQSDNQS